MRTALLGLALLLSVPLPGLAASASDETAPVTCGNRLVAGIRCTGAWCDNVEPLCGETAQQLYDIRWTGYVSEEGEATASCHVPNPFEQADWPTGEPAFISGFSCRGPYCDSLALECVALVDALPGSLGGGDCRWTEWVSEETGTLKFARGSGAIRMQCKGAYCDSKRFFVCPIRPR